MEFIVESKRDFIPAVYQWLDMVEAQLPNERIDKVHEYIETTRKESLDMLERALLRLKELYHVVF